MFTLLPAMMRASVIRLLWWHTRTGGVKEQVAGLYAQRMAEGMHLIDSPLLVMAGAKADTFYMSEQCFSRAEGTKNKELFLIEGAAHIQTYHVPEYVDKAVDKLTKIFNDKL